MKVKNMTIERFIEYIGDKHVYIYGLGDVYQTLTKQEVYKQIYHSVAGYIDNGKAGQEISVSPNRCQVYGVDYLKQIDEGVVLLCSTKYLDGMYKALCEQNLPDSIECFVLSLIWAVSDGLDDSNVADKIASANKLPDQIERKIHCFWFSGEEKPEDYQKCIDSWKRVCPDYEIIEWNTQNYDCEKVKFTKQALQKRKWAFVSDYARLDVIYQYGGIYLDMDVELIKRPDAWLKFGAFFNFGTQHMIDLGSGYGSVKNNPFIGDLLKLYQDAEFCDQDGKPMMQKYVQPMYIKDAFQRKGIRLDGSMQLVDDMLILPRRFHTPVDDFLLENFVQTEETVGIHHYNAGWCSADYLNQRKEMNFWRKVAGKLF